MSIEQHSTSTGSPSSRLAEARKQIQIARDQLEDSDYSELEQALNLIEEVQTEGN